MIRVFYGPDTYRSREAYAAARGDAARRAATPPLVLREDELTPATLQAALEGQPLFGTPAAVAVERLAAFTGAHAEQVARALTAVPRGRAVLVWEDGIPPANGIVWRALRAAADHLEEFSFLAEPELLRWMAARAKTRGRTIEPAAARLLAARCGADLWRLSQELEKALLVRPAGAVTVADVEQVGLVMPEADLFRVVEAFASGDGTAALRLLAAYRRAGEDLRRLWFLVIRDLGRLVRIRGELDRGQRVSAFSLARELRLPRTAAETLLQAARRTAAPRLRTLLDRAVVAYYHLNSGRADVGEVLESLALGNIVTPTSEKPSHTRVRG